jgi:superfamily II DNA or RNA helicase
MIKLREHQEQSLAALREYNKGQIIVPTGGGKTMIAITDAQRQFKYIWEWDKNNKKFTEPKTIIVVAPRILLAEQLSANFLEHITNAQVLHVHSGETHHTSTTNSDAIREWSIKNWKRHKIIFTTYHSLHRIQEAQIVVDTVYFDEAHNSVQRNFIGATEYFSMEANRCYFFTATPKHSMTPFKAGMNDEDIYGKVLCSIPAPKLVEQGYILPPKVIIKKIDVTDDSRHSHEKDCDHVIDTIDDQNVDKILICARSTRQIVGLFSQSAFGKELHMRGYSWMYITSKTGAIINGKKVNREKFFNVLNTWGREDNRKFVVVHHSILSEGINVPGLEAALFLRNMDYITISQTIGRVIRTGNESKTFGLVVVPTWDRVGISTSRKVNAVVDTVFKQGQPAISVIKR